MKNNLLPAALLLLLNACNSTRNIDQNSSLGNYQWQLSSLDGVAISAGTKASLQFHTEKINLLTGHTGCNQLTGSFELSGTNQIHFPPVATTRMACIDTNVAQVEKKLLEVLGKADHWQMQQKQLLLLNGSQELARFNGTATTVANIRQLNGSWELAYMAGTKNTFGELFPHRKPVLVIALPLQEVNGNGGCNGYGASVKVAGDSIRISNIISTMMACEGGGEPYYFKALESCNRYQLQENGKTLELLKDDQLQLRFIKK